MSQRHPLAILAALWLLVAAGVLAVVVCVSPQYRSELPPATLTIAAVTITPTVYVFVSPSPTARLAGPPMTRTPQVPLVLNDVLPMRPTSTRQPTVTVTPQPTGTPTPTPNRPVEQKG